MDKLDHEMKEIDLKNSKLKSENTKQETASSREIPNRTVCPQLKLKQRDLEECNLSLIEKPRTHDKFTLTGKFLQLGGFRSSENFEIGFETNGEMNFNINGKLCLVANSNFEPILTGSLILDSDNNIKLTLGCSDIIYVAAMFHRPLYALVFYVKDSISEMYLKDLKELPSFDTTVATNREF